MKCPRVSCGYEWSPRTLKPKKCPKCNQWIKIVVVLMFGALSVSRAYNESHDAEIIGAYNADLQEQRERTQEAQDANREWREREEQREHQEQNENLKEIQREIDHLKCQRTQAICL